MGDREQSGGPTPPRFSVERDKSRSTSDERSVVHTKIDTKVNVVVDNESSTLFQAIGKHDLPGFQIRPNFGEKFSTVAVDNIIESVLIDFFNGKTYNETLAEGWVVQIGKELTSRVQQLNFPRYKFVTHVVIGENTGGGVHVGMKCQWDADSDSYATHSFLSVRICKGD